MKETRFEAISLIQQIVMSELKLIREEEFFGAFNSFYERCKYCVEAWGTILSNGINNIFFYLFCMVFFGLSS
jgi:hypothetical protein